MGEKYGAVWGPPAKMVPALDPPGIFAWTALEFSGGHGFAGNSGIFRIEIPGEHLLRGNPCVFQEHITVEPGFAGNSVNISFCPFTLLTSGYA